ncbi:MAG: YgjV family protein [Bacteroidetes bacterium]|nr:YgjV family protein [Bacteroidota bacterium]
MIAQLTGYIASVLLAVSLMVTNDLKFRWLNTLGCLAFIVYGILISAFPVILTNTLLLAINTYYLVKIYRTSESFDLLEYDPTAGLIVKFLSFYSADIHNFFPEFKTIESYNNIRFVVTRDIVIANVFAATLDSDGTAIVNLNYTVEKYRDYKVGRFIFDREKKYLISKGVKRLVYMQEVNKNHSRFLEIMGFKKEMISGKECMVKVME